MSVSSLIFGMIVGAAVATGSLYYTHHLNFEPTVAVACEPTETPAAPSVAKKPAPDDELAKMIAKEDPAMAGRAISDNARETMAAANTFKKRMEGDTTGNENVDRALKSIEEDEKSEAAPVAAAPPVEQKRAPATATVIEMDGSSAPSWSPDEEKIMALNVPDSVRQEILKNYRKTGQLPPFVK